MEKAVKLALAFQDDYMVTITLEGSHNTFKVQKALLCSTSEYFKKALNGRFKESGDRTLKLLGCEEETFQLVLYWLVHRTLPDAAEETDTASLDYEKRYQLSSNRQVLLIKVWSFGDACLITKLQNEAMRSLLNPLRLYSVSPVALREAFATTSVSSVLREVLMTEIVPDLYDVDYDEEEMAALGAIPGFLGALLGVTRQCGSRESASSQDPKQFMVRE
ncbi:hypothetical protein LTR85_001545 [Meristemomyces frigidus]|nr:hypothetical protein LTR85_001545 [Meristemomyces frigidus]